MKIVFVSLYSGLSPRGVETHVHELANRLSKKNDVTVFQGGPKLPGSRYRTVTIKTAINWSKPDNRWKPGSLFVFDYRSRLNLSFVKKVLNQNDADTDVLVSTNGLWQSMLCRLWSTFHGKKLVIVGHSGPGIDDRFNLLCRPDVFIALTNEQKNWSIKNGLGVRVGQIPNGVDLDKYRPSGKTARVDLPKPLCLCVAGLEKNKRVDLVIRAIAKTSKISLLVLGDGPEKEPLNKLAGQLIPGRFQITKADNHLMPGYYRAADIFTMAPIPNESFGIVYLEAMATNLPIVAADDPIRREIVGAAGLFIDPTDTEAYAQALKTALEKKWGEVPRRQAEKFSWDRVADQYQSLFENLK